MSAAVVWALALVLIVAIIVVGVYFIARSTGDDADKIREQRHEIARLLQINGDRLTEINRRDNIINQLRIDLQTEKNRIHRNDE